MAGTKAAQEGTVTVTFNGELFDRRMRALGYATEERRAKALGTSRGGLHRLRHNTVMTTYPRMVMIAAFIGVDVDALFVVTRRAA